MVSNVRIAIVVILILLATAPQSVAQRTTATFAGIVTDPSGAVLPGAQVEMINEGTAAVTQQLTSETGEFVFNFVPVGAYTLKIAMAGFRTFESKGIPLGAAQNVRRTYTLEIGNITDNVTVTGEAPLVNTLSPEQRFSIDTLEIKNLPMVNRNITNLLEVGSGLTRQEATLTGRAGARFRLNGLGGSAMTVTANGTDGNGSGLGTTISQYGGFNKIDVMSAEAVGEVQVVKGVIPAEYGSAMAGNMSLITKSGTNDWHGSLFHRYEGSVLSARNPILTREPNSVWNQFGGSVGGPIRKDKAFFFVAYEGYRQRTSIAVNSTFPTPLFRNTMLTALPVPETKLFLDWFPVPNQPFASNALLGLWIGPGLRANNDDHVDWKVDHLIGGGTLSVAFSGGHPFQSKETTNPLNPQLTNASLQRGSLNYVIGRGRWVSSSRFGYNRNHVTRIDKYWYVNDPNHPVTVPGWRNIGQIAFPGMTALERENHETGTVPSWSAEQQIALIRGTHSWKFGGILSLPGGALPNTTAPTTSFQTLDDVLRNEPSSVAFTSGRGPGRGRQVNFGFFAQDDWRVNRKLVLNLGLRYDRYGQYVAKAWHQDLPAGLFNLEGLLDPVNFTWGPLRDPSKGAHNPDPMSLGPRFGFAYTADDRGDFVVRGGFGVNFQGYEMASPLTSTARTADLPASRTFTRAEAGARGIKWPNYTEDVAKIILAETAGKPQVSNRWNPNLKPPYAYNYTLGIQRALTSSMVLETAFVGTRGVKFNLNRTYNRIDRVTAIRPNPTDIQGSYLDNSQQTNYNSWQTSLKQRFNDGLLFNIHYTWGKAMAYTGGDIAPGYMGDSTGSIEDFLNVKIERNPSTGDVTHNVVIDWVYQIPTLFRNSAVGRTILGGWQLSGIWKGATGVPIGVTQTGGRPDIVDFKNAVNKECCSFGNLQYLNPAAFQQVPINRGSNLTIRRGYSSFAPLRGPGIINVDVSLGKSFALAEKKDIELKADILNLLNQTQYTTISTNMDALTFGRAVDVRSPRVIQLQLRLTF